MRVLQVPPASTEDVDYKEQPPIRPPDEHDTHRGTAYYRTVQRTLGQQDETALNLATQQATTACGPHQGHRYTQDSTTRHQNLRSMVTAIWRNKRELHTVIHSHDPKAQKDAQNIAV